jgi:phosphate-selective porin OprO and OprP
MSVFSFNGGKMKAISLLQKTRVGFLGLLLLAGLPSEAADKELLDILKENGAITPQQYDRLIKKEALTKEDFKKEPDTSKGGGDVSVSVGEKGLVAKSSDGDFELKVGGRIQVDASYQDPDSIGTEQGTDGTEIRRGRIEMKGRLYKVIPWAFEVDFANNDVSFKDVWLGYEGLDWLKTYAGQNKQPYSLAVEMSSNDIPFMERAVDNALIIPFIDRTVGLRMESFGDDWFWAASISGESVSPTVDGGEGWGLASRFVYTPIHDDRTILHLGGRAAYRMPNDENKSIRMRDETTNMSNLNIVDTGNIANIDNIVLVGPEASFVYGPFSITGEFNHAFIDRESAADLDFDSWHAEATWSITGESRAKAYRIDSGEFKRLIPEHPFNFSNGQWGAWELATRIAYIDLNDGDILGGRETAFTAALNWYLFNNVRLMWDYSHILDTDGSNAARIDADGMDIYQMRAQVTF